MEKFTLLSMFCDIGPFRLSFEIVTTQKQPVGSIQEQSRLEKLIFPRLLWEVVLFGCDGSALILLELPYGWEEAFDEECGFYYIE